jgi:hypothetical protein
MQPALRGKRPQTVVSIILTCRKQGPPTRYLSLSPFIRSPVLKRVAQNSLALVYISREISKENDNCYLTLGDIPVSGHLH